jgi:hypothetical protein
MGLKHFFAKFIQRRRQVCGNAVFNPKGPRAHMSVQIPTILTDADHSLLKSLQSSGECRNGT